MTDYRPAQTPDGLVHAVVSTSTKEPAGCPPAMLVLNMACETWEYADACYPGRVVTCPDCKAATNQPYGLA